MEEILQSTSGAFIHSNLHMTGQLLERHPQLPPLLLRRLILLLHLVLTSIGTQWCR